MSLKHKLVLYFLVLSLLPLGAAYAGFRTLAEQSETRRVDARLGAGLRAAIAAYDDELAAAARSAADLAGNPEFQRALARRDRAALRALLVGSTQLRVSSDAGEGFMLGRARRPAAERHVAVRAGSGEEFGTVTAALPLDRTLARRLRARSGLDAGEQVLIVMGSRIVAASGSLRGVFRVPAGSTTLRLADEHYRVLAARPAGDRAAALLAVASPQARIEAAQKLTVGKLLAALVLTLVLVLGVAYLEGRAIVRTVRELVDAARAIAGGQLDERVPVRGRDELALLARTFNEMAAQLGERLDELEAERGRLRESALRFGDALAATHDTEQLLHSVVETIVEATAARGGVLVGPQGEVVRIGEEVEGGDVIEVPLIAGRSSFGTLILSAPGFGWEDRETAVILAGQAVVALENARLHDVVRRQALVDELTGLANRRQAERVLEAELRRSSRFGTPVSVLMIDLDSFKAVNDGHGHAAGDAVLRVLAAVLEEGLREFDVPARWGGEEFLLVLPGTDAAGATVVAERLREALSERIVIIPGGGGLRVSASFGVASHPPAASRQELVAEADAALYEAKRAGRNRVATARAVARGG